MNLYGWKQNSILLSEMEIPDKKRYSIARKIDIP